MINKRQYPRVGVSFPVECKALPSQSYFYTVCKDLSLGGVKIINNDFISTDDYLKININLIDKVINLKAKVAWCSKERVSERYSTGLTFVEMNQTTQKDLSNFLNKASNH